MLVEVLLVKLPTSNTASAQIPVGAARDRRSHTARRWKEAQGSFRRVGNAECLLCNVERSTMSDVPPLAAITDTTPVIRLFPRYVQGLRSPFYVILRSVIGHGEHGASFIMGPREGATFR
jgi:hypothetical protein